MADFFPAEYSISPTIFSMLNHVDSSQKDSSHEDSQENFQEDDCLRKIVPRTTVEDVTVK